MTKLSAALVAGVIVSTFVASAVSPADALGLCGPNRHRNAYGYCVFGGQNQNWCLRHTGHFSADTGGGTRRCY